MLKLALLDMYDGTENLGVPSIKNILSLFPDFEVKHFHVRSKCEVPGLDFDVYISTGGPGNPLEGDGLWDRAFFNLMDKLWIHNQRSDDKKYVFFICHSFQMIAHYLSLGSVVKRNSRSFGVFPVHKTEDGCKEVLFNDLKDPFYAADFRFYQFVRPNHDRIKAMGAKILALEKIREHVPLERAVMSMRFSDEWFGVQFHPEASPEGMITQFNKIDKKASFIESEGEFKFDRMMDFVKDENKLGKTYSTIIPKFLNHVLENKEVLIES